MSNSLCSIIIPTYNHGKYIERSIESALAQTYKKIEVIVVDDGSTDDTPERVKKFGDSITYIRKKNTGRGHNRNVAIEASKGKYIQFLDSDDIIDKRKLEIQMPVLENDESIAVVYSDCSCTDANGNALENVSYPLRDNENPLSILLKRTLFGIHAGLTRRSVIIDAGMFDTDNLAQEDWDLWLKIAIKGFRYKYMPGNLAHYDQVGSGTVTNSPLMYRRTLHMLNKYKNSPEFMKLGDSVVEEFVAQQNLSLATRAYNNAWWKLSRGHYVQVAKFKKTLMNSQHWVRFNKSYLYQLKDFFSRKKRNAPAVID